MDVRRKGPDAGTPNSTRVRVYGPGGHPTWRVSRVWGASRGRPEGLFWAYPPLALVLLTVELMMMIGNLIARIFFGHPWPIEAKQADFSKRWLVEGWRESGEAMVFIARSIRASGKPPAYVPGDKTPFDR